MKLYNSAYCPEEIADKSAVDYLLLFKHLGRAGWSCADLNNLIIQASIRYGFCLCYYFDDTELPHEICRSHVEQDHRFGECDKAKRFFDLERFREHLSDFQRMNTNEWFLAGLLEDAYMERELLPQERALSPSDYDSSQRSTQKLGLDKIIAGRVSSVQTSSTGDACVQCREEYSKCDGLEPCGRCIWHQRAEACAFRGPTQDAVSSKE